MALHGFSKIVQTLIKVFKAGYGFGSSSGIIFKNGKPFKVVSTSEEHNSYFVSLQNGELVEEKLEATILK